MSNLEITEKVRERYAAAATSVDETCCGSDCSSPAASDAFETSGTGDFGAWLYEASELADIPDGAALASLGCGNPTAVASLAIGDTVLDLGSGAGIDVLLSAQRVGPKGYVYGIDMTDEMLDLARKHQAEAGATNVEFRKGMIEDLPLDDAPRLRQRPAPGRRPGAGGLRADTKHRSVRSSDRDLERHRRYEHAAMGG